MFLLMPKFETSDNKIYKVETIQDNVVYAKKRGRHLLRLYYLVT